MSFMRYFAHDYWQTSQIDKLDSQVRRMRSQSSRTSRLEDHVDEVEDDLGRALLLLHAFIKACVRKGLLTDAEISAAIEEIDLADGVRDGKLDPATMRPAATTSQATSSEGNLRQLEKREVESPSEFLRGLENEQ